MKSSEQSGIEKNTLKITTAPKFKDEINLDPAASAPCILGPKTNSESVARIFSRAWWHQDHDHDA